MISHRSRALVVGISALVLLATGCSSAITGHESSPSIGSDRAPVGSDGPVSSIAPSPTPVQRSTPTPTQTQTARTLCADATHATETVLAACLRSTLSTFWSGQINNVIDEPVFLDPPASSVPAGCRAAIAVAPAFTCKPNLTLYIDKSLLAIIARYFTSAQRFYAFASVQAHEFGHVLQFTLRQPQIESGSQTEANSQFLEQQADCLSGVWAAHATGGFDRAEFTTVADHLVALVSTNPEIATHGTPTVRAAAIARGLASGRPQACKLTTFS